MNSGKIVCLTIQYIFAVIINYYRLYLIRTYIQFKIISILCKIIILKIKAKYKCIE